MMIYREAVALQNTGATILYDLDASYVRLHNTND